MLKSVAILILAMLSIQFGATQAKQLFDVMPPAVVTMIRATLAAFFLLVIFKPWRKPLSREAWRKIVPYGAVLGLMNLTFYWSLQRIPLGIVVTLEFIGPLGVAFLGSKRWTDFLWVFVAGLGIYLLMPTRDSVADLDFIGVLLALVAGVCWGLYIVFGKRISSDTSAQQAASYGMVFAALTVIPFGLYEFEPSSIGVSLWGKGILVAILSSAIPYTLEMIALKRLDSKTFGTLMSIEPAIAAVMGILVLGEILHGVQWLGMLAIITASMGVTWKPSAKILVP